LSWSDLQQAIFELLDQLMPKEASELLRGTVQRILSERHTGLLSFGLLFGVWSATSGILAVMEQLDMVSRPDRPRPALRARAVAFTLLIPLSALTVLAFGLVVFGGALQDWLAEHLFGRSPLLFASFEGFRWLVVTSALLAAVALLYRLGPTQAHPFRLISAGSVFATLGMIVASIALRFYVAQFGSYDALYGSLGAVIVMLLWLFSAAWVFLLGAAIDRFVDKFRWV
jgi:membrane protein